MLTSKERMLCALECRKPDYVPCSFMIYSKLYYETNTQEEYIEEMVKMGLDAVVSVGKLRHSFHPEAKYNQWTEIHDGNKYFYRRIDTPKGPLTQRLIQRLGWPDEKDFHEDYSIFNDYVSTRMDELLVKPEEDLEKLQYFFGPFSSEDINSLREQAIESKKIADKYGLLQFTGVVGWGDARRGWAHYQISGADTLAWLSGFEVPMILSITNPELMKEYLRIVHEWNMKQIEICATILGEFNTDFECRYSSLVNMKVYESHLLK